VTAIRTPKPQSSPEKMTVEGQFGRYTALGFRSASIAEREGRSYSGAAGDAHSRYDRPRLINQSRDFYRNNGIYKGMIDRAVSYIVGNGFGLQVKTDNASFNKKVEALWNAHNKRPEIRGLLSGAKTVRMFLREAMIAGDVGAIKTNKGVLQLIEADQIDGGHQGKDGVEKNMFGSPVGFWISRYNDQGYLTTTGARKIEPKDFLFMTNPDRPSSTRGVPACQSSFAMLHRINDACDSEAIGMQLLSRLVASITRENADTLAVIESKEDPNKAGTDTTAQFGSRLIELEYALLFHGKPGEKVEGIDHNIPGKNFSESLRTFLRLLGLPLGLPLELILLDWTNSNYSQSRAVLEQAFEAFLEWQDDLQNFYYDPHFDWKLEAWRAEGLLGNRREVPYGWIKPTYPWIDQLKEMQAKGMMIDRAVMTHAEACKSRGMDREEVVELREKEIRDAIERAQRIKADTSVEVDWRLFAGLSTGKSETVKAAKEPADGSDIDEKTDDQESDDE
jgi:capsid protein